MIYTDGLIALFAFGGVYAAGVFGWTTTELGLFGILLTVTGTIGALVGGRLDDRLGGKPVILGSLVILAVVGGGDRLARQRQPVPGVPGDAGRGRRRPLRDARRSGLCSSSAP